MFLHFVTFLFTEFIEARHSNAKFFLQMNHFFIYFSALFQEKI